MSTIEIGSRWKRRVEPATDDGWQEIVVTGIFDQHEINEVVVRQADTFGPTLSVAPADLEAAFDLEQPASPAPTEDIYDSGAAWL
jgi:hypothetical protein